MRLVDTLKSARGETPKAFLKSLSHGERSDAEDWLHGFYAKGRQSLVASDPGPAVIRGFESGQYASEGEGALAVLAFMRGVTGAGGTGFAIADVLEDCRAAKKASD